MTEVTADLVRDLLDYDPEMGRFIWRITCSPRAPAGSLAGFAYHKYRGIGIRGKIYLEHRLAYLWMMGEWPPAEMDHINRDRQDNRWTNLRPASPSQNRINKIHPNKYGFRGISIHKPSGLYRAEVRMKGVRHYLGYYKTPEEAGSAYILAAQQHHGEFLTTTIKGESNGYATQDRAND